MKGNQGAFTKTYTENAATLLTLLFQIERLSVSKILNYIAVSSKASKLPVFKDLGNLANWSNFCQKNAIYVNKLVISTSQ